MSAEFIVRIIGMVGMAVGGIYLGVYLGDLASGPPELWAAVFAMVGALMGLVITPFLPTRPVRAIRSMVAQVSAQTMVSGLIGLVVGLIIAALISFPLSLLPAPFGQLLPFIGALFFVYLGVTIFVLRQNDTLGWLRSRLGRGIHWRGRGVPSRTQTSGGAIVRSFSLRWLKLFPAKGRYSSPRRSSSLWPPSGPCCSCAGSIRIQRPLKTAPLILRGRFSGSCWRRRLSYWHASF